MLNVKLVKRYTKRGNCRETCLSFFLKCGIMALERIIQRTIKNGNGKKAG